MILWHDNIAESQIIKKWKMKFPNKCLDFESFRYFLYQFSQFYYYQFGRDKSKIISPLDNKQSGKFISVMFLLSYRVID